MKKTLFAVVTVLLALVIVTCDLFPPPAEKGNNSNVVYDENGAPWGVNLTIKTNRGIGRSMSGPHAETWTDYYEVVFLYDSQTYRARWREGDTGRIAVPFGVYSETDPTSAILATHTIPASRVGAAIMFAGQFETRTLLAVGNLTLVNTSPNGTGVLIDNTTTSVTFTLTPLVADVKAAINSSFQITETNFETASVIGTFPTVKYKVNGKDEDIPIFEVNGVAWTLKVAEIDTVTNTTEVVVLSATGLNTGDVVRVNGTTDTATISVSGTTITFDVPLSMAAGDFLDVVTSPAVPTLNAATYTITGTGTFAALFPYSKSVFITSPPKLSSSAVLAEDTLKTKKIGGFKLASSSKITDTAIPTDGKFTFELVVPVGAKGLSFLALDIPVRAMAVTADPNGDIWHIRGGIRNTEFDLGVAGMSNGLPSGGKILLGTPLEEDFAEFEIVSHF